MACSPSRSVIGQGLRADRGDAVLPSSILTCATALAEYANTSRMWVFDKRPLRSTRMGPCRADSNPMVNHWSMENFQWSACASDRATTRPYRSGLDMCRSHTLSGYVRALLLAGDVRGSMKGPALESRRSEMDGRRVVHWSRPRWWVSRSPFRRVTTTVSGLAGAAFGRSCRVRASRRGAAPAGRSAAKGCGRRC